MLLLGDGAVVEEGGEEGGVAYPHAVLLILCVCVWGGGGGGVFASEYVCMNK